MSGRTAVITGGSGGIGSALARRLHAAGWNLVLAGRREDHLAPLAAELAAAYVVADVTKSSDVALVFERARAQSGQVDAAVHCVGSILLKSATSTTDEEWDHTLATNLSSAFYFVRESMKSMRATGGNIVLMSSAAARTGLPNHEAIAAAKAGIIGLAQSAAASGAAQRIRVNVVAPGLVRTPLAERITSNEASLKVSTAMHPLGRIGEADEVASSIEWLLSAEWVTGQVIGVDGGLSTVRAR